LFRAVSTIVYKSSDDDGGVEGKEIRKEKKEEKEE